MAATPPLRTTIQTPPTPLHGAKYDEVRPRSIRKSTRIPSSRTTRAIETPPPHTDHLAEHSVGSRKSSSLPSAANRYSPPSSTPTSPCKRAVREKASMEAANTGLPSRHASDDSHLNPAETLCLQQPYLNPATSMLPTPAKTPRKKPVQQAAVNAAARVLFPARSDVIEDAMPTPRKRRNRRNVGFSIYDSIEDDPNYSEDKIEIYTDSKDKVPELDTSADNPFYEQRDPDRSVPEPKKRKPSMKRKIARELLVHNPDVEEAFNRDEGMVYVFRGKKIFRTFPDNESDGTSVSGSDAEPPCTGRLTRSSIKPRLLFPTARQKRERQAADLEDEEAPTDIEEPQNDIMAEPEEVTTPVRPTIISPSTPPATGHVTRATTKKNNSGSSPLDSSGSVEESYHKTGVKKISPFDGWARTKRGTNEVGKSKKRAAEVMNMDGDDGGSKRLRGNRVERTDLS